MKDPLLLSDGEIEHLYAYGFAYYNAGKWREAIDVFRVLCANKPLEGRFWFGLSAALQEAKSYSEALQSWGMTSLLQQDSPYPHFHAAEVYLSLREREEAGKALKETELRLPKEHPLREKIAVLRLQWMI